MHIAINLASEPFRKDRPVMVASVACAVALLLLLAAQTYLILGERERAAENRETVAELNGELARISTEQAELDATLREPANAEVLQRSVLLNNLIERKGISWTHLFADIEGVLPNRVRLIQIRLPEVNTRNEVTLDMEVGAESPQEFLGFMQRLQTSPLFGPPDLSRSDPPTDRDPLFRYRITVSYAQQL